MFNNTRKEALIKISKKVEYALMTLRFMANKPKDAQVSVREICQTFHIPFDTTAKVMQALSHHGILDSSQGIKGGYKLSRSLQSISFLEVSSIAEGKNPTSSFCQNSKGRCDLYETCNIVSPIEQLNFKVTQYLESLTLEQLFKGHSHEPHTLEASL